ncbi:MAG: TolC family protein, partial [Chitinophagales bacterium]
MKNVFFFFCLLLSQFTYIQAQRTNFDRIVIPPEQIARDYKENLVQLAWINNPDNKVLEHEVKVAEIEKDATKWSWAESLQVSFNFNEGNFRGRKDTIVGNLFFPKYNFSANFSIGTLISTSKEKKLTAQKLDIAHHRVNQRKLLIRAETLKRYEDYLTTVEMLKLRTQAVEDFYATYLAVSKKFKESRSTLEEYNQASTTYYTALEN